MATSSIANEPALFDFDVVYRVPPTAAEAEAFERALLDIMEREGIDLVIPCRDDDVEFLASLRDRRPGLAQRLLCGSAAPADVFGDKWLSAQFCARHGLPFAASIIQGSDGERAAFVEKHGFPLVAKPRRGYASLGVYMLWNETQLRRTLDQNGYMVQQFLGDPRIVTEYLAAIEALGIPLHHTFQGTRHSIQALIAPDGAIAQVMSMRIVSDRRRSKWVELDTDPAASEIGARCAEAFSEAGWRGPLNIQCARTPAGTLLIHEFNGRFTGATVERWLLGYDEVRGCGRAFHRSTPSFRDRACPRGARGLRIHRGPRRRPGQGRDARARRRVEASTVSSAPGFYVCAGDIERRMPGWLSMHGRDDADLPLQPGDDFPFEDRAVDVMACGDFVAALPRETCIRFLLECRRVLKPGGVLSLRVASPEAAGSGMADAAALTGLEPASVASVSEACRLALSELRVPDERGSTVEYTKRDRGVGGDPLVSIVIPAYSPRFFTACLDSALAQTHANLEIVVCDDSEGTEIEAVPGTAPSRWEHAQEFYAHQIRDRQVAQGDRGSRHQAGMTDVTFVAAE